MLNSYINIQQINNTNNCCESERLNLQVNASTCLNSPHGGGTSRHKEASFLSI